MSETTCSNGSTQNILLATNSDSPWEHSRGLDAHSNIYGPVVAKDNSMVQLGNTYIFHNVFSTVDTYQRCRRLPNATSRGVKDEASTINVSKSHHQLLRSWITLSGVTVVSRSTGSFDATWLFLLQLFGRYLLFLGFQVAKSRKLDLSILHPRLYKIVPDESPLMLACSRGDVSTIRHLLSSRSASIHDVTADNLSPLFFAIKGGHTNAVEELFNHGADYDQYFGENQTLPLAWALHTRNIEVVRSLIRRQSCLQHMSGLGWSLLYYLWIDEDHVQESCVDLMQILQTADAHIFRWMHQNVVDIHGFSILNRVARMGTPEEIQFLVANNADLYSEETEFGWNALFFAASEGKLENLSVLTPYFSNFVEMRDVRGWTLLHVAAAEGHANVVRYLLQHGADPYAESWPSYRLVHEDIKGLVCTPADVARIESADHEHRFLQILEEWNASAHDSHFVPYQS